MKIKLITPKHDFFLNNYDNKTYLDASQSSPSGFPIVLYVSSNLPNPYLDTRFGDPEGEKAYSVGSLQASDILANTGFWYGIFIVTNQGNTDIDSGKLQGQLGERSPSWVYSPWAVYSKATYNLIPAWSMPVPIYQMNWQRY
ncbi:MAG: hypothetical protein ABIH71_06485 [Candidatus Omnitrophota bacterium]